MKPEFEKIIATHKWGNGPTRDEITSSNGFVLCDLYSRSLTTFKMLAEEAKKDFPDLSDDDIECFVVTKSSYNKGCPGVRFSLPDNARHPDYHACERVEFEHA